MFAIPRARLFEWWPHIQPHLRRFARDYENVPAEYIRDLAESADAQVWALGDETGAAGVVITQVREGFAGRAMTLWIAAGDIDGHFREFADEAEAWGGSLGCWYIEIIGRRGWERVLPDYRRKAVVLQKSLEATQ